MFVAATFLSAFLVFLVQPMLGRFVLPWFGGGPSVWTVCMLFFQAGLLGGYAYAHLLVARLPFRRGVALHLGAVALSLLTLPITPAPSGDGPPTLGILGVLVGSVGVPYALLSATAPLLQAWAARGVREPWRLYAWSNAGSLLALLAYPLAVEPTLGRVGQTWVWSGAYAVLAALLALCGRAAWRARDVEARAQAAAPPTAGQRALWVALSACASVYLVATTDALTEDLSAAPFLWVLPLALYLLTFILCFGRPQWMKRAWLVPLLVVTLPVQGWALYQATSFPIFGQIALQGAAMFVACLVLHGEMVRLRPAPAHLTGFYLLTSLGGALGGLFVGVIAPLVLPMRIELHLAMIGTGLLVVAVFWREHRQREFRNEPWWVWPVALAPMALLGWFLWGRIDDTRAGAIWLHRNFFGVLQVKEAPSFLPGGPSRRLVHGRIAHGRQFTDERRGEPISYYGHDSGVGQYFAWASTSPPRNVGVVGLGVGTVAAFGRPGDTMTFFEINPDVERAARALFTYLEDSRARVDVVLGDARKTLEHKPDRPFDALVLDAFSSDAIPAHLLTREAFALYFERLTPGGVLVVNISNRHLDLRPVVRAHAAALGLEVSEVTADGEFRLGLHRSRWLLVTRDPALRRWLGDRNRLDPHTPVELLDWTDDFTPLLPLLRALR